MQPMIGYKLFQTEKWQLSPIARYRFFDIPKECQNEIRESGLDLRIKFLTWKKKTCRRKATDPASFSISWTSR
jgi:hypothetical protein